MRARAHAAMTVPLWGCSLGWRLLLWQKRSLLLPSPAGHSNPSKGEALCCPTIPHCCFAACLYVPHLTTLLSIYPPPAAHCHITTVTEPPQHSALRHSHTHASRAPGGWQADTCC